MGRALTIEEKRKKYRKIFEILHEEPRIYPKEASKRTDMKRNIFGQKMKEALEQGYITGPHIRKKSFKNFKECVCYAIVEDPIELYERYAEDESIIYHSILDGFCNFRVFSGGELNIEKTLVSGLTTDRYMSFAPNCSWEVSLCSIEEMIRNFDPDAYTPKNTLKNHWDKTVEWTEIEELLYREFKYDFRRPISPIMKKHHIQRSIITNWLKRVPECCNFYTAYFPETIFAYDPIIYMFETDYEDFVIDLFSELPTTIFCYKISEKLFIHTWLDKGLMQSYSSAKKVSKRLPFLKIIRDLQKKEIVRSEAHATERSYWRRDENI